MIEECNTNNEPKIVGLLEDMIADILRNKKTSNK